MYGMVNKLMKKLLLLTIISAVILSGCGVKEEEVEDTLWEKRVLLIDKENFQIIYCKDSENFCLATDEEYLLEDFK